MPTADQFIEGFHLHRGQQFGNYVITNIKCEERQVQRWNSYEFHIQIFLNWTPSNSIQQTEHDINNLQHNFDLYVRDEKIIRSNSGRPFICNFNVREIPLSRIGNKIILNYLGFAQRTSEKVARQY